MFSSYSHCITSSFRLYSNCAAASQFSFCPRYIPSISTWNSQYVPMTSSLMTRKTIFPLNLIVFPWSSHYIPFKITVHPHHIIAIFTLYCQHIPVASPLHSKYAPEAPHKSPKYIPSTAQSITMIFPLHPCCIPIILHIFLTPRFTHKKFTLHCEIICLVYHIPVQSPLLKTTPH